MVKELSVTQRSIESLYQKSELINKEKCIVYLGRMAIDRVEHLGINDPVTHLYDALDRGHEAFKAIKQDIETDIAERLPKTPFVNMVDFKFFDNDFISVKDSVSMDTMTKNNLKVISAELSKNKNLRAEYERALIESQEVNKLAKWFISAKPGSYMVFESLPIGDQKIAISRIYQKTSDNNLKGAFVSLYSPDIATFNDFRKQLNEANSYCANEKEILEKNYEVCLPNDNTNIDNFVSHYVDTYDQIKNQQYGREFNFGLDSNELANKENGIEKVRKCTKLTDVYLDVIRELIVGKGKVTDELLGLNRKLSVGSQLKPGQDISIQDARNLLGEVITGIASSIDKADISLLSDLAESGSDRGSSYAAISYYGSQAKAAGESYSSNGCPEYSRTITEQASASEENMMASAFSLWGEKLNHFGEPKIGVCRISNCPSRGNSNWYRSKTLVGGCDICVNCHKIFASGKSPKVIYKQQKDEKELKDKKALEKNKKLAKKSNKNKNKISKK